MNRMSWFRGDEGVRINSNWIERPDGTGGRIFSKGVNNASKTVKNTRFKRIVSRKFQGTGGLPIDLINMVAQAYEELNKARRSLRRGDVDIGIKIVHFMRGIRKNVDGHLKSIPYDDKSEKHKNELLAYNDFLYDYYYNKGDKLTLTEEASARVEAHQSRLIKEGKTKVQLATATKELIDAELANYAQHIIQKWCVTITNYRKMYHTALPSMSPEASLLCAAFDAPNGRIAAPVAPPGGSRTRKMRRH